MSETYAKVGDEFEITIPSEKKIKMTTEDIEADKVAKMERRAQMQARLDALDAEIALCDTRIAEAKALGFKEKTKAAAPK